MTQKFADYQLFKRVLCLIINKEHLTVEGLNKVVAIRASLNLGLSEGLKKYFPNIIPEPRPCVNHKEIISFNPFFLKK